MLYLGEQNASKKWTMRSKIGHFPSLNWLYFLKEGWIRKDRFANLDHLELLTKAHLLHFPTRHLVRNQFSLFQDGFRCQFLHVRRITKLPQSSFDDDL